MNSCHLCGYKLTRLAYLEGCPGCTGHHVIDGTIADLDRKVVIKPTNPHPWDKRRPLEKETNVGWKGFVDAPIMVGVRSRKMRKGDIARNK